ncbi:hypothetical protein Lal_00014702 [Lupinus albus]|nr:hypothetical protein Lal_00014702 [Lupinus albus]
MVSHTFEKRSIHPKQVREEEEELETKVKLSGSRSSEPILAQARKCRLFKISDLTLSLKGEIFRSGDEALAQERILPLKRGSYSLDMPKMPLFSPRQDNSRSGETTLAIVRQLSLKRESFCIVQDFTLSGLPGEWHVSHYGNRSNVDIKCSCRRMKSFGMPCSHSVFVLLILDISQFPSCLVLERWTKKAKNIEDVNFQQCELSRESVKSSRYGALSDACRVLCNLACEMDEDFSEMLEKVYNECGRLRSKQHSSSMDNVDNANVDQLEPKLATSLEPKLATSLEPKLATLLEPKSLTNHGEASLAQARILSLKRGSYSLDRSKTSLFLPRRANSRSCETTLAQASQLSLRRESFRIVLLVIDYTLLVIDYTLLGENFEEKRERRAFQEQGALGLILELEKRLCSNTLAQVMKQYFGSSYVAMLWLKLCSNTLAQVMKQYFGSSYVAMLWLKLCSNTLAQVMKQYFGSSYVAMLWLKLCSKTLAQAMRANSRSSEPTLAQARILQYRPGFHPPRHDNGGSDLSLLLWIRDHDTTVDLELTNEEEEANQAEHNLDQPHVEASDMPQEPSFELSHFDALE